jgi:tRNA (cytidine/uridine-2'-O-)-methyltransferase
MFDVILYQPEIPPNTGNIMRLCANTGARLHLIEPLGFALEDKQLRRAGLDYRDWAEVRIYPDFDRLLAALAPARLYAFTTRGPTRYTEARFQPRDALLFGPETRGLPPALLERVPASARLRLPLVPGNRSLNLSNAVAIALYEAWRQLGFSGGT